LKKLIKRSTHMQILNSHAKDYGKVGILAQKVKTKKIDIE